MAGLEQEEELALDGCNILPLMHGESDKAVFANGRERESIFWYYPAESHMSAVIRKGNYKLIRNYGIGMKTVEGVQLFKLTNEDGSIGDLGEMNDLSNKEPVIRDALLAELEAHLADSGAAMPYRNFNAATKEEQSASPGITKLGSQHDRVWAEYETGKGKAVIKEALFLYTLTPKYLDATRGRREEWFAIPVTSNKGRVEARMPPGATHGAFCLRDANNILITSEPMPSFQEKSHGVNDSDILENGFAYKPGLFALIQLGKKAKASAEKKGLDTAMLDSALLGADQAYAFENGSDLMHAGAIRFLRAAIRELDGTAEAQHVLINRFPNNPLF